MAEKTVKSETSVPAVTANETFAANKYAHLVRQPSELSMLERMKANTEILRIVETATSRPDTEYSAVIGGYAELIEYIRDNFAHDPERFDTATVGASAKECIEFVTQFRDAVGE